MTPVAHAARLDEIDKYVFAYKQPGYHMGPLRQADCKTIFHHLERGSHLDVGAGRGQFLTDTAAMGFEPVRGTEVVGYLCDDERIDYGEIHKLPHDDDSFDIVSCIDVMEHILIGDDVAGLAELFRVARRTVFISLSNKKSLAWKINFHINIRPYEDWGVLIEQAADADDDGRGRWKVEHLGVGPSGNCRWLASY